jgi:hypothetical protein
MEQNYIEVVPVIEYPLCIKMGKKQNCFECNLQNIGICTSPRSHCTKHYKNHKKGCPNYGKRADCPPLAPMFDEVFDISKPIYAIFSKYDLYSHIQKMRKKHPQWTEAQLLNVLYWQGTARKLLKECIVSFDNEFRSLGYYSTISPEAMGVNVTKTLESVGIILEWPARRIVYKVAMAGIPLNDQYLNILR